MATTNYGFPTISAEDSINGVSAVNGLANAIDAALKTVDDKASGGETYVLPPATASSLGGIIVGNGLSVSSSGKLDATVTPYVLPAATTSTLGGVKVGTGLAVDASGVVSVNTTWLAQQIESAVSAYMAAHYQTGTTWGNINANGFIMPKEA